LVGALACGPAVDTEATTAATDPDPSTTTTSDVDPGEQPSQAGAMYSACEAAAQCGELEFCVFPPGEAGYCSAACLSPTDPSGCDPAPGEGAGVSCLDIGIPDGRQVCALDCSQGACPTGMRCEGIETGSGERSICF
jgi:hypothetical protein